MQKTEFDVYDKVITVQEGGGATVAQLLQLLNINILHIQSVAVQRVLKIILDEIMVTFTPK